MIANRTFTLMTVVNVTWTPFRLHLNPEHGAKHFTMLYDMGCLLSSISVFSPTDTAIIIVVVQAATTKTDHVQWPIVSLNLVDCSFQYLSSNKK